jgi:adenylylsulfate reductase subunit A
VNLFEKWGMKIWLDENGEYVKEGSWKIMIKGEYYKVIVDEEDKKDIGMEKI